MADLPISSPFALGQAGAVGGTSRLPANPGDRQAALEFEAVFLAQMMGPMFQGLSTQGPFGGGHAEEVYRSLLIDEYGKLIAKTGGVGIADQVMAEILKTQEI